MSNGMVSSRSSSSPIPAVLPSRFEHVVRVVHRNQRWEVAHNQVTRPMIDWLCTRERAIDHAFEMAEGLLASPLRERVLVVIEGVEHVLTNDDRAAPSTH